ncbi:MAG: hypothetical protein M1837_005050 [Sclerophora amabilis]|nr:MAG: hypothetical protein M1837_005050 [Sclerophora amabilis]
MATTQSTGRRRSARLAFEDDSQIDERDGELPHAKRPKREDGTTVKGNAATMAQGGRSARKKQSGKLPRDVLDIGDGIGLIISVSYEEDDGGFRFTRTRSKKAKAPQPSPRPSPEPAMVEKKAPPAKRKKSFSTPGGKANAKEKDSAKPKRRSPRFSGPNSQPAPPIEPEQTRNTPNAIQQNGEHVPHSVDGDSERRDTTRIALPFSDTPVIKRNKEFRKNPGTGHRRSSIGLRGRRASSLIDNGSNAAPHREVEASDFYKHISGEGLSEPRRMKQLLLWCGTRAMGDKPLYSSKDSHARLAARVIQEDLLKDFSNRSDMSDWFNREDTTPAVIVKKPNPRNIANSAKVHELEAQIKRLEEEREEWESLRKPPLKSSLSRQITDEPPVVDSINSTLLDPEQVGILSSLSSNGNVIASTSSRLTAIASSLEFKVDQLADGTHKLEQYQETANRVAGRVLAMAAEKLDRREKEKLERAGTSELPIQEVLRSIAALER